MRRWLLLLWLAMMAEAIVVAPPASGNSWLLFWRLLRWELAGINLATMGVFNGIGVLCLLYASYMLTDVRAARPRPGWAVAACFALGSFALLPYFALRQFVGERVVKGGWLASPILRVGLAVSCVGYLVLGAVLGNVAAYGDAFRTDKFIHVMTIDLCVLIAFFPVVALRRV